MVDLGEEADLGRVHWVFLGEEELEVEDATCLVSYWISVVHAARKSAEHSSNNYGS